MKKILVPLANGFEEIEAVTIIDILRRGNFDVTLAALAGNSVKGAHHIVIETNEVLSNINDLFDAIILPGGMPGASNLLESSHLRILVKDHFKKGKLIGAICAAPWVLAEFGILEGKKATVYPGFEDKLENKAIFVKDTVVISSNVITSRGPGTAMEFALKIVELLSNKKEMESIKEDLLY